MTSQGGLSTVSASARCWRLLHDGKAWSSLVELYGEGPEKHTVIAKLYVPWLPYPVKDTRTIPPLSWSPLHTYTIRLYSVSSPERFRLPVVWLSMCHFTRSIVIITIIITSVTTTATPTVSIH